MLYCTCNLSSTAAGSTATLFSEAGQLRLQHLQPAQDVLHVVHGVVTAARLLGNVDAVGEHDLVLPVHRVLQVLCGLHVRLDWTSFGLDLGSSGALHVYGTQVAGGDIDVVDVVEDHWLVSTGEGYVVSSRGCQSCPFMPKYFSHQPRLAEAEKESQEEAA